MKQLLSKSNGKFPAVRLLGAEIAYMKTETFKWCITGPGMPVPIHCRTLTRAIIRLVQGLFRFLRSPAAYPAPPRTTDALAEDSVGNTGK